MVACPSPGACFSSRSGSDARTWTQKTPGHTLPESGGSSVIPHRARCGARTWGRVANGRHVGGMTRWGPPAHTSALCMSIVRG